ncbi:MAG: lytic transglycosylase domain-containing protein [Aestuariivirga sp.]|uniref:lytic transglycosylase domain-containing protein n=1 Tax=Aestuariivirga sp. TaxID=2650926 RepID=UPI00301620AC
MKNRLIAGMLSAAVLAGISAIPAEAACKGATHCYGTTTSTSFTSKPRAATKPAQLRKAPVRTTAAHTRRSTTKQAAAHPRKRVHVAHAKSPTQVASNSKRILAVRRSQTEVAALAVPVGANASQGNVISLIKAMAPSQGVPTWFALRIAHVESNYNPNMRGSHGEYGVFQMKCATAKDIGFSGNCAALLDPRTNIQWGLRHLALAIGKSDGNLRLAASKHNGGLGRRTLVASYVAKVF